jgi:hypothetical protein
MRVTSQIFVSCAQLFDLAEFCFERLLPTTLYYREPSPSIWRSLGRHGRLERQHRVQKIANRPGSFSDAQCHCWRRFQGLVDAAPCCNASRTKTRPPRGKRRLARLRCKARQVLSSAEQADSTVVRLWRGRSGRRRQGSVTRPPTEAAYSSFFLG